MRLLLVFNPAAGRGRARRHVLEAVECLRSAGASVDLRPSASPEDLTKIAAEGSRSEVDALVVCGGDGTLHLALRELDLRMPVGLLPFGSGNDFARVCAIPKSLRDACHVIVRGKVREVDVALANGKRYLGVAGLGFDSEVARYANENKTFLRGSLVYLNAIFRVLPKFEPHRVLINGVEREIMFAAIGNSTRYGGGIHITPGAEIDDGLLDLCVVHKTTRVELLKTLPRAYSGAHVKSPFVSIERATSFTFQSQTPLEVYADGEALTTTPLTVTLAPQRLRFIVP